ncbi:mucin-2-like [Dorcoceras hygrometricum]|uniref:Mucin-2-like n=1 Tax=Dorcoceras hygrometricum TaxID=472368 RepID=A0A2Z7BXN0_9LAMI|nr:mucin-2-like [Dorcoceras hygrometricum]
MRTRGDKRPSRKNDRKVLMAEESTKSWADTDSDSSSSSSSSSDSEQEEVHCLMADQTSDDEVFDFSNVEFTREDLVSALNDMVKDYRKLSHTFEQSFLSTTIMASSLISSSLHISFDSVLGMDDAGLVAVFESFVPTGLNGFLGCPTVYYEDALTEFFQNGLVRDGMIVSTIQGILVEISKEVFAVAFELPMEGLTDLSKVLKDLVFDARIIFSESKVQINWSSLVFDILKNMVTPGSRQAKGYAIQICVLLKNVPGLELGESRAFPSSMILTEKTVHRYVVINEKVGGEDVADAPKVKKTHVKKAASKKRPATDAAADPVVKKKRTTKSKSVSAKETLEILPVVQEAVPLQMIAPIQVAPTEQPPVPKRKTQKRKRKLILSPDDEIVDSETATAEPVFGDSVEEESILGRIVVEQGPAAESIEEKENEPAVESTADDVDTIIEQVIAETAQL